MNDGPIDLAEWWREHRAPAWYDGALCDNCGNAWFDAQVVIDQGGSVTGWRWPPTCTECKQPLRNTTPAHPRSP